MIMVWASLSYFRDDAENKAETEQIASSKLIPQRLSDVKASYVTEPQFKFQ